MTYNVVITMIWLNFNVKMTEHQCVQLMMIISMYCTHGLLGEYAYRKLVPINELSGEIDTCL